MLATQELSTRCRPILSASSGDTHRAGRLQELATPAFIHRDVMARNFGTAAAPLLGIRVDVISEGLGLCRKALPRPGRWPKTLVVPVPVRSALSRPWSRTRRAKSSYCERTGRVIR